MIDNTRLTITDADVAKLEKKFVTKDAFKSELKKMRQEFAFKFDAIIDQMNKDRNLNTTRFDVVMGELRAIREDTTIAAYQISDSRETLEDHETRITTIEEKIAF